MRYEIDYEAIRQRVEKRVKDRREYFGHLAAYVGVIGSLWFIWFFTSREFPWPIFPTVFWGIAILIHTATFVVDTSMDQRREELIDREIRREKMRLYGDPCYDESYLSKPKRRSAARDTGLSDDGDLVTEDRDEVSEPVMARRGNTL